MELLKSLVYALISPSRAFEWVREHPVWLIPVLLLVTASIFVTAVTAPYYAEIAQHQLEQQANTSNMSPEDLQKAKDMMDSPFLKTFSIVAALVLTIIGLLVQTVLFHFATLTLGGSAGFSVGFALIAFAQLPIIIQMVIQSVYTSATKMILQPGLSAMVPVDQLTTPLGAFLSRIDIFTFWSLILIAIGLPIVYKISKTKAYALAGGYWVLGTILAVIVSAISGGLS